MSKVSICWHDEQRNVLRHFFCSGFSYDEAMNALAQGQGLRSAAFYPIAILTELQQPFLIPKGYVNLLRFNAPTIRSNELIHVVVGSAILIRSVLQLAARINIPNLKYIRIADSTEQGLELCQQALKKSTLPIDK